MSVRVTTDCAGCARQWQHCHGTWVEHADRTGECTEQASCTMPPEAHVHVVLCVDTSGGCCPQPGSDG